MEKDFVRKGLARRVAQMYAARLLLNAEEHVDAFEDEELTEAEKTEARAELRRIAVSLRPDDL